MDDRFTEAELAIAKRGFDRCCLYLGYTVKKVGHYHTLKEMDSIRIYDKSHWFRWSRQYDKGENGGSQIDFLRVFCGMEVKEAVWWLLDFAGYRRIERRIENLSNIRWNRAESRNKSLSCPYLHRITVFFIRI